MEKIEESFLKIGETISNYVPRKEQLEISKSIYNSMVNNKHSIIEAGTGIGKSFAYLVAAVNYIKDYDKTVIVSIGTKVLQKQVSDKDLPVVIRALGLSNIIKTATIYGGDNYVCKDKFNKLLPNNEHLSAMKEFVNNTNGLISEYRGTHNGDNHRPILRTTESCSGKHCKLYESCGYYKEKEKSKDANLLIVNHSLLCSNVAKDFKVLPPYDSIILDEAHDFIDIARNSVKINVSLKKLERVKDLYKDIEKELFELSSTLDGSVFEIEGVDTSDSLFDALEYDDSITDQFKTFLSKFPNEKFKDYYLFKVNNIDTMGLDRIFNNEFDVISLKNKAITKLLANEGLEHLSDDMLRVHILIKECFAILQDFNTLFDEYSKIDLIKNLYFISNSESANFMPIDVSNLLMKGGEYQESIHSLSATLGYSTGGEIDKELYLQKYFMEFYKGSIKDVNYQLHKSPFNYKDNCKIYTPDVPAPVSKQWVNGKPKTTPEFESYINSICNEIKKIYQLYNGSTLVLFTSNDTLKDVYFRLKNNYQIYSQHIFDVSGSIQRFKDDNKSMLFGVNSMWQGIDIKGDQLKAVIIVKLMFQRPNDPVNDGISQSLTLQGRNAFTDLQLPYCINALRQGFGRLIRTETDTGLVAILDDRINKSRFKDTLLINLPDCQRLV